MKTVITLTFFLFLFALYHSCVQSTKPTLAIEPTYVGSEKCQSCHTKEYDNYLSSDHFHAMDTAMARSVKANFNNSFFIYYGDTSYFYTREGKYYMRTKDLSGKKADFLISYTFGWQPLQQYLVRFPDGRIQALPFCWDTRPK